jgi:hypothetical protein
MLQSPTPSQGILSDVRCYLLRRPEVPTLLRFDSEADREEYSLRVLQRIAVDVTDYTVLNIHRIGIDCPLTSVFEELRSWGPESIWWPNHLSTARHAGEGIDKLRMMLLGHGSAGNRGIRLFELAAQRIVGPDTHELDSARYLLYECRGGYPIGMFAIFLRSPIAGLGEVEQCQLFFAVSFDFWGKKNRLLFHAVSRIWEAVHNRATANILNRLKGLLEAEFHAYRNGAEVSRPAPTTRQRESASNEARTASRSARTSGSQSFHNSSSRP